MEAGTGGDNIMECVKIGNVEGGKRHLANRELSATTRKSFL